MNGEGLVILIGLFVVSILMITAGILTMNKKTWEFSLMAFVVGSMIGSYSIGLYNHGFPEGSGFEEEITEEDVMYKEITEDFEVEKIFIKDGEGKLGDGELRVGYMVKDEDGFMHERSGIVDKKDMVSGEEYKIVEEYHKEEKERTGYLKEVVVREGGEGS